MTDTTITVAAPEAETTPAEITLAIATGVALAEAERAGEEADELSEEVETLAGEVEAATETALEAIAASRNNEDDLEWLKARVLFLEDLSQSPPIQTETTEALLILPNSEDQTDPATLTPEPTPEPTPEAETPLTDISQTGDPASGEPPLEVAAVLAQPRRKRRLLI